MFKVYSCTEVSPPLYKSSEYIEENIEKQKKKKNRYKMITKEYEPGH